MLNYPSGPPAPAKFVNSRQWMSVSEYPSVNYSQCITMNHEIRYTQACPPYGVHRTERIYTEPSRSSRRIAQKPLIMQNEPKFKKARTNASAVLTKDYGNLDTWWRGKNEPKTNPKRTQTKPNAKSPNERKYCFNKELQRKMNNERLCKTNPISKKPEWT